MILSSKKTIISDVIYPNKKEDENHQVNNIMIAVIVKTVNVITKKHNIISNKGVLSVITFPAALLPLLSAKSQLYIFFVYVIPITPVTIVI